MESSNVYYKMQSMNQALERLVREGKITQEEAISNSDKREDLILKLSGVMGGGQGQDSSQSSGPRVDGSSARQS